MNSKNLHKAVDLAKKLNKTAVMYNEDSRMVATVSESSKVIFNDADEMFIAIRTNHDYTEADAQPFRATFMEYDSVKMVDVSLTVTELMTYLKSIGQDLNQWEQFFKNTTATGTINPSNFNVKYKIDDNGEKVVDEDGKPIVEDPVIPSVTLGPM